ncbi:MAG: TetR/AcrR family transcriptional regulator [Gammaproteobacteria bacterium]|nr:TetR/AcrR family transcriptional regulator [Gammaproteobacteria bacterium]
MKTEHNALAPPNPDSGSSYFESLGRSRKTKDRMVIAALELFAKKGINNVSLRTISEASGSSNTGAAQYHFGNKLKLIRHILSQIEQNIWRPAEQQLQEAIMTRACLRKLLMIGLYQLKIAPLRTKHHTQAGVLVAYCAMDPDREIRELAVGCSHKYLSLLKLAISLQLPHLTRELFEHRWRIFITETIVGEFHRDYPRTPDSAKDSGRQEWIERQWGYLANLLEYTEAGLRAPASDADELKSEWRALVESVDASVDSVPFF